MAAKKKPVAKKAVISSGPISLTWRLDELPSSQYKTGLAGLVLMIEWLAKRPSKQRRGVLELTSCGANQATIKIDLEGLKWLFDETYAASAEEQERDKPFENKKTKIEIPPLRIEEREVVDAEKLDRKTRKPKTSIKRFYIYNVVVPDGAFLREIDENGPWTKLWRDFVWAVPRGKPASRGPYNVRATANTVIDDTDSPDEPEESSASKENDIWTALTRSQLRSMKLAGTYLVGAESFTADAVGFRALERFQFLLHFWPFAVGIFVPSEIEREGKPKFVGYALSFSDIIDLREFCTDLHEVLKERRIKDPKKDMLARLPRAAVLDLPAEAGLQFMHFLRERLLAAESKKKTRDLVLGVDIFHVEKEGNNVRVRSTTRVEPNDEIDDEYATIRLSTRDALYRRQRLRNLLEGRDWSAGFDRLFATLPAAAFIRGRAEQGKFCSQFPFDVRAKFKQFK